MFNYYIVRTETYAMKNKPSGAVQENPHKDSRYFEATPETILEVFNESKDFIKMTLGLELSIIELVHLRRIAGVVTRDISLVLKNAGNIKDSFHVVAPWQETTGRFFLEFYGVPSHLLNEYYDSEDGVLSEYLKRKQIEHHMP